MRAWIVSLRLSSHCAVASLNRTRPNYTPRISGIMHIENGRYNYAMSILKSNNGNPEACNRYTFAYENCVAGEGHFIHTYKCDGNPLPSFEGEPKAGGNP